MANYEKSYIDKNHYRLSNGEKSYLFETGLFEVDRCIEVVVHHKNRTKDAYEADNSVIG